MLMSAGRPKKNKKEIPGELPGQDPKLKNWVVHTDNVGQQMMNIDLSRKRAAAVVAVLTGKHNIDADRLRPEGLGPLAPVASSDTEEGRSKNRRVELVKQ